MIKYVSGVSDGGIERENVTKEAWPSMLAGFSFGFLNGDHHLKSVLVGSDTTGVFYGFADKNSDDPYSYFIARIDDLEPLSSYSVPGGGGFGSGEHEVRIPIATLEQNRVRVLHGFGFGFTDVDHHLDQIGVRFIGDELVVRFSDQHQDKKFNYAVSYGEYPTSAVSARGTARAQATAGSTIFDTAPGAATVIAGFEFNFRKNDHHVLDFSVFGGSWDKGRVRFADDNRDDPFDWVVDWVRLNNT